MSIFGENNNYACNALQYSQAKSIQIKKNVVGSSF
jgi:hypothetical protein